MTERTLNRSLAYGSVLKEQVRVVGLAVRREMVLAGLAFAVLCILGIVIARVPALLIMVDGSPALLRFDPGEPQWGIFAVFIALAFPLLVWRGERPFGSATLWSLPVDHRTHCLTKVAAGWVWLMVLLGAAVLLFMLTFLAAGGTLGVDEIRHLVIDPAGASRGVQGATRPVPWTTPWWEWIHPLAGATAGYLITTTLLVGTRHPVRWAVVLWLSVMGLAVISELARMGGFVPADGLTEAVDALNWFFSGDTFTRGIQLPDAVRATGWTRLPTLGLWLASAAFWIGLGVVGTLAASARPRDL